MDENATSLPAADASRRDFLRTSAGVGAGLAASSVLQTALAQEAPAAAAPPTAPKAKGDDLNVAVMGVGAQGRVLIEAALRIPGIRFKAVCDIWAYSQQYGSRYLKKYGHTVNVYEDYRELLEKEKDLDAVIVATPDWMHAEHANACMRAGLHVYCEKEMSNSLEKARTMVQTAKETGKLLQIGHQRRSNPRYIHAVNKLIRDVKLLGRVTHGYGQWNRAKSEDLGWPERSPVPADILEKYGYASMSQFRNWRWYKKYGGGPIVDLGSHQIDIFTWVFGRNPSAVTAAGGIDFYKLHEWYDNVMAIFDYETPEGTARAFYQVLTTTSHGGFYETFMGENGSLLISEVPSRGNAAMREPHAPDWDPYVKMGLLSPVKAPIVRAATRDVAVDVRVTMESGNWPLPVELAKPAHQPHLENFFNAIRLGVPLNCPAQVGYETAVAVLRVNEAVEQARKLHFNEGEFLA
jgi:predicted dehydrogenase